MKKFIFFLLLMLMVNPVFAGNLMQQEYETSKMAEMAQDPVFYNKTAKGLIEDDYLHYLNGGGSLYGVLKYKQEKLPKDSLDLKYVNLMLAKYDIIIKNINPQLVKPDRIVVEDDDYRRLSDDVKSVLSGFNLIMSK